VVLTRAEHNRVIDILNERNIILNALREAVNASQRLLDNEKKRGDRLESVVEQLMRDSEIQLKRIAQIQAEHDMVKRGR
jgi:hypothetical protein